MEIHQKLSSQLSKVQNHGEKGIQNFLKGEARKMAQELGIPLEEAEDCFVDLLEMERTELDPSREAKV